MPDTNSPLLRLAAQAYLAGIVIFMLFHVALILGLPWGTFTMGGQWQGSLPLEGRLISLLSIAVLAALAWPVAAAADFLSRKPPRWALFATLAYQLLAIGLHIITPSAMERILWLPLILFMTVAVVVVIRFRR